jgi:putative membrane protein
MNRRLILTSIATLIASPALAQTDGSKAATPASNGPPAILSAAGLKHIKDTMNASSFSLLISRIAAPKVTYAKLKEFADFEIAEQETVADVLKTVQSDAAPKGSIPSPADAELMQNLDSNQKAITERLRGMRSGVDFDREYIKQQLDGHRKLLEIQQTYLRAPDNLDETGIAKLASGMIKEHLTLLGDLARAGGGSARITTPRGAAQP